MSDIIQPQKQRVVSLDVFRGFTIFLMLFVNHVAGFTNMPFVFPQFGSAPVSTFKHASNDLDPKAWATYEGTDVSQNYRKAVVMQYKEDSNLYDVAVLGTDGVTTECVIEGATVLSPKPVKPNTTIIAKVKDGVINDAKFQAKGMGCTATDWVAPFFVFIVGVCIPISWRGRKDRWWSHVLSRTFWLIFVGILFMSSGRQLSYWWGILQAIGVAYFLGAVVVMFEWRKRLAIILAAGIAHMVLVRYVPWWTEVGDTTKTAFKITNLSGDKLLPLNLHCTPWGSLGYGLCTMIGTVLGEAVLTKDPGKIIKTCLALGISFIILGLCLSLIQPQSKDVVSTSYAFFTSGLGALIFLGFYCIVDIAKITFWIPIFTVFGANALLAFCLQPLVRIPFDKFGIWQFFIGHNSWNGVLWALIFVMLCWCITWYCNRRNWYWKF